MKAVLFHKSRFESGPCHMIHSKPKLYRIELPYAVFGIEAIDDEIINAAPMGSWMKGRSLAFIKTWVMVKYGTIEEVSNELAGDAKSCNGTP